MSNLSFDLTLQNVISAVTLALMLTGLIGGWYTYKSEFKEWGRRQLDLETKVARIDGELAAHKLHSSEHFVRRDDIDKLEDRLAKMFGTAIDGIGRRMETVEHTVRNIDTKILSIVQMVTKPNRVTE